MSQSTSITEGGKGRPFGPVKALMVEGDDGKYYPWYPESDRALDVLSVSQNGVYQASKLGVYGWSRVYVNVPQNEGVSGKDPDTGEDVYVHPDPETGELVEDVLPVRIEVIEPPTNPYGIYVDGQTITKDGMVVKAYNRSGEEMLTVPLGEITINPTTAIYDEAHDTGGWADATSDDVPVDIRPPQPIRYSSSVTARKETYSGEELIEWEEKTVSAPCVTAWFKPGNVVCILYAASSAFDATVRTDHWTKSSGKIVRQSYTNTVGVYTLVNEKPVYYGSTTGGGYTILSLDAGHGDQYGEQDNQYVAYVMVYGDSEGTPKGSSQTITVSWPRPQDGAVLETTFDIFVGPLGGSGED